MYPFSPRLPSHPGCLMTLSRVAQCCPVLCSRSLFAIHFKQSRVHMTTPNSLSYPFPPFFPSAIMNSFSKSVSLQKACILVPGRSHEPAVWCQYESLPTWGLKTLRKGQWGRRKAICLQNGMSPDELWDVQWVSLLKRDCHQITPLNPNLDSLPHPAPPFPK